jgi:chloramphenicol-sensitive protein RarD
LNKGILQAFIAYAIWGLFPLYWRLLLKVPALQIVSHRIIWSWVFLIIAIALTKQWRALSNLITYRVIANYSVAAALISVNWLVYIWAVNANHVIETSLGYFINPLFSVFLGTVFFKERLHPWHWLSLAIATVGVGYLTYDYGRVPWIALALAATFSLYGLVKKTAPLKSLFGLTLETTVLVAPAILYLAFCEQNGSSTFLQVDLHTQLFLILAGLVTVGPLLLFASAAQSIPLTMIGILQYTAPTLQILLGIFFFREPFSSVQLLGFAMVWIALAIFVIGGLVVRRKQGLVLRK